MSEVTTMAINRASQNWPADAVQTISADSQDVCPNCGHVIADGEFTTGVGFNNTGTMHVQCPQYIKLPDGGIAWSADVQSQTAGK